MLYDISKKPKSKKPHKQKKPNRQKEQDKQPTHPHTSNQTTLALKPVSFEDSSFGINFLSTESSEHAL